MAVKRILQLTDLHVFSDPAARLKGIPTFELLKDVVEYIRTSEEPFDYLVITGDHTHDELSESYGRIRTLLAPWIHCLYQVPGNHDDRFVLRSVFSDRVSGTGDEPVRFVFRAGNWLCLGLDTHIPGEVAGQIDEAQIEWSRVQLSTSDATRVALFFHHPPTDVGSLWMDAIGLRGKELLQQWLLQESRIRLVCCGHVHHEFRSMAGCAEIVTTPSTGIQFSPIGSAPAFVAEAPGYRVIELNEDSFSTWIRRLPDVRYVPESG